MFTFAGKKPEKYDFPDVPLLDGNFVNETHIKYGDTIIAAGKERSMKNHNISRKLFFFTNYSIFY